jgi:hypothetical protein
MGVKFPVKPYAVNSDEYPVDVSEVKFISTNSVSQWTINTIMSLGLIGELLPKDFYNQVNK